MSSPESVFLSNPLPHELIIDSYIFFHLRNMTIFGRVCYRNVYSLN